MKGSACCVETANAVPGNSFIYVIGASQAVVKVGVADFPTSRLMELQVGNPDELFIFHTVRVPRTQAFAIERRAHDLLRDCHRLHRWTVELLHHSRRQPGAASSDRGCGREGLAPSDVDGRLDLRRHLATLRRLTLSSASCSLFRSRREALAACPGNEPRTCAGAKHRVRPPATRHPHRP